MDFIPIVAMFFVLALSVCGVICIGLALHHRRRHRELAHQERMAMIEKGLYPSTADEQVGRLGPFQNRRRSVGSFLIGLGFAFMVLITFAGDYPGIGVGGALIVLGLTFYLHGVLGSHAPREGGNPTPSNHGRHAPTPDSPPPPTPGPSA